jgi:hypothetical protein
MQSGCRESAQSASSRRWLLRLSTSGLPTVGTIAPLNLVTLNRIHREALRVTHAHTFHQVATHRT